MLDGQRAEPQVQGDLGIGLAAAHALQHLALARGQGRRHDIGQRTGALADKGEVQMGQQQLGQVVLAHAGKAGHAQEDEQAGRRRCRFLNPMDQHVPPAEPGTGRGRIGPGVGTRPPPLQIGRAHV